MVADLSDIFVIIRVWHAEDGIEEILEQRSITRLLHRLLLLFGLGNAAGVALHDL